MPIYDFQCGECGHRDEVMRKIADPSTTTCPSCGAEAFSKMLSAAGFQLKGSGWYATDFKGGAKSPAKAETAPESGGGHTCGSGCSH